MPARDIFADRSFDNNADIIDSYRLGFPRSETKKTRRRLCPSEMYCPIQDTGKASWSTYKLSMKNYTTTNKDTSDSIEGINIANPNNIIPFDRSIETEKKFSNWEKQAEIVSYLKHCSKLILSIVKTTKLPNNWDSYEGTPVNWSTCSNAIILLSNIFDAFYILDLTFIEPFIAPCPDGSIQFEWEYEDKELEIIIPENEKG